MHKHVHQQELGDHGAVGLAVRFLVTMEQEQEPEHVRSMVDAQELILRTKLATKERVHLAVTQLICLLMPRMFQIQQFGLVPMEILMDLCARKVVLLAMLSRDVKRIQPVIATQQVIVDGRAKFLLALPWNVLFKELRL